ncbi:hypothetical protein P3745_24315 [Vibrio parahaemolyticus]|nr:hypothetical protein [Vibrio parahaemolyticus]MDF4358099.1 hypothetical protein [Vibrio parahaemolyticus]MDF4386589.1 hypothetical protein [Vibrio parahaemolyticus]MDF4419651.1 hypothetical protein [Vibrio parahaemolyticus]MDF4527505.1 hypothetical protein [Vibrio parahaemolyticus]
MEFLVCVDFGVEAPCSSFGAACFPP